MMCMIVRSLLNNKAKRNDTIACPKRVSLGLPDVWTVHVNMNLGCSVTVPPGLLCQQTEQLCESTSCHEDQNCVALQSEAVMSRLQQDHLCLCPPGPDRPLIYTGAACDQLLDPCLLAPCGDCGGTAGTLNYTCACTPLDSGGEDCVTPQEAPRCSNETCQNGGACPPEGVVDGPPCLCPPGYSGDFCQEEVDECTSVPCRNGAICVAAKGTYGCYCVPGFQGSHCELDINECASAPCVNGGSCRDQVDHYRCECAVGFKGRLDLTGLLFAALLVDCWHLGAQARNVWPGSQMP